MEFRQIVGHALSSLAADHTELGGIGLSTIREKITTTLLSDPDLRNVFITMALLATHEMSNNVHKLGFFKDKFEDWEKLEENERRKVLSEFSAQIKPDAVKDMVELIMLGVTITGALVAEKINPKMLAQIISGDGDSHEQEISSVVGAVMHDLDRGKGICEKCGNLSNLKAMGPNGEEVCQKCFLQDQSGATNAFNASAKKLFGDRFVVSNFRGVAVPKDLKTKQEIDAYIENHIKQDLKKEDISKFN